MTPGLTEMPLVIIKALWARLAIATLLPTILVTLTLTQRKPLVPGTSRHQGQAVCIHSSGKRLLARGTVPMSTQGQTG